MRHRINGFCAAMLLGILLTATSCSDSKTSAKSKPTVSVIKLTKSTIPLTKDYIGITQSIASVNIRARVQGFLTEMNFVEGKLVKKDQLLFKIDPRPFQAKLNLAQGQLSRSIANKEFQAVQFLRMKELVAKGDVAKSRFDEVTAQYRAAEADVQIETAQVEEAQINLGYCSMYSPFDGMIGEKFVDVGNLVGGADDTLLANVVRLDPIYVQFSPSVNDYKQFLNYLPNMPFNVQVSLPQDSGLTFTGKVDLINNQADTPTSTILMRAIIDNPKQLLLPGIYVNIKLILTLDEPVLLVPSSAISMIQGQQFVYVVENIKVVSKKITVTGQYQQVSIIGTGLKVGDLVINNGLQKIQPGQDVTPEIITTPDLKKGN